ncbi:MAG TPA: hypothetical protein PKZ53_16400 [Acidobacteriota bacterium]|nr:hypothetical protein [Acidobacteriota bacterium]HNJ42070.1 hypothetical protein [Acidobacteriota bacterium]
MTSSQQSLAGVTDGEGYSVTCHRAPFPGKSRPKVHVSTGLNMSRPPRAATVCQTAVIWKDQFFLYTQIILWKQL